MQTALHLRVVRQHVRVRAEAAKRRDEALDLDQTHAAAARVLSQPLDIGRQLAALRIARADHPCERVAGAQLEQAKARMRPVLLAPFTNHFRNHDREGAVPTAGEHRTVAASDDRTRNVSGVVQAARHEQITAEQDLVQSGDHFLGHALGVAVHHHRDPRILREKTGVQRARAAGGLLAPGRGWADRIRVFA